MRFGLRGILGIYCKDNLKQDIIICLVISVVLSIFTILSTNDVLCQLRLIMDIGLKILPTMIALNLASYTLMLSLITSDKFLDDKKVEQIKQLKEKLNSSFAIALLISIVSIVFFVIISVLGSLDIFVVPTACVVNSIAYFLSIFLLAYCFRALFCIVIDLFNIGQVNNS